MSTLALLPAPATRSPRQTAALTSTLAVPVDATPAETLDALLSTDLAASVARALRAVGLTDRLAMAPARIAPAPGSALALGLAWRFDGAPAHYVPPGAFAAFSSPGHVKAWWDVAVRPAGEATALLTVRTRFEATDHRSRERLLDAWGAVGPFAASLARRAAAAVKAAAEEGEDEPATS